MTPVTNEQLRKLLLRHLTADEVARVEEAILTEEGVAERLGEEEFDLIDDYARGNLSEAESADMERYVLTTPEHVESLRIARALAPQRPTAAAAARLSARAPVAPAAMRVSRKHTRLLPVAALLAAGLVAVVVIPHWGVGLGPTSTVATLEAVAPSVPSAVERAPDQTIILLTDTNRGGSRPVVHLASDAVTVRLQAEVPGPASNVSYSLRVDDAAGSPVIAKSHLSTRVAGPYTFVEAVVPAQALGSGALTIFLSVDGAAKTAAPEYRWQINTVRDEAAR